MNRLKLFIKIFVIAFFLIVSTFVGLGIYANVRNGDISFRLSPSPTPYVFSERKLWNLINDWKKTQSSEPYIEDSRLCTLAEKRLEEVKLDWTHDGFWNYKEDFIHEGLAENLGKDYETEEEVFNAWLESPSHRRNLDYSYKYSCLRCEGNNCVHIFGNF